MERNKQLKIIQAVNTEIATLERERNVYLEELQGEVLNGNESDS
jgi:hypothetical protein